VDKKGLLLVETIYIAIPSMVDTETSITVENAILAADNPERVFIGVSFKDLDKKEYSKVIKLSKKYKNISVSFNKLKRKKISQYGTGDGRYRSHQLYSGQDYMLQIDSHTLFQKGWDSYLIDLFKECKSKTGLEKFVITTYLGHYSYSPERKIKDGDWSKPRYPYYLSNEFFIEYLPKWDDKPISKDINLAKFIPCVKFNGNFAFGDKNFINNTGVFKDAVFYDEEIIQAINLIGNDIAMVFPNVSDLPLTHLYGDDINGFGGQRTYFNNLLNEKGQNKISERVIKNYLGFLSDPKNKNMIKKYEKYARIDARRGAISNFYIPKYFIVEDKSV
jgi:hypothetical protein